MNTRKKLVKGPSMAAVVIIGLIAAASWHTARTEAQGDEPRVRQGPHIRASLYGLHELTRGQTARLSVVNAVLGAPPEDGSPRRVTLAFDIYENSPPEPDQPAAADGSVHTLRFLRRVSHTLRLRPGEAASFEFEASRAGETIAAWVMFTGSDGGSPVVSSPHADETIGSSVLTNPPEDRRLAVVTSLEVRQGNRTQFVLPAVRQGFDPQPEPPVHR